MGIYYNIRYQQAKLRRENPAAYEEKYGRIGGSGGSDYSSGGGTKSVTSWVSKDTSKPYYNQVVTTTVSGTIKPVSQITAADKGITTGVLPSGSTYDISETSPAVQAAINKQVQQQITGTTNTVSAPDPSTQYVQVKLTPDSPTVTMSQAVADKLTGVELYKDPSSQAIVTKDMYNQLNPTPEIFNSANILPKSYNIPQSEQPVIFTNSKGQAIGVQNPLTQQSYAINPTSVEAVQQAYGQAWESVQPKPEPTTSVSKGFSDIGSAPDNWTRFNLDSDKEFQDYYQTNRKEELKQFKNWVLPTEQYAWNPFRQRDMYQDYLKEKYPDEYAAHYETPDAKAITKNKNLIRYSIMGTPLAVNNVAIAGTYVKGMWGKLAVGNKLDAKHMEDYAQYMNKHPVTNYMIPGVNAKTIRGVNKAGTFLENDPGNYYPENWIGAGVVRPTGNIVGQFAASAIRSPAEFYYSQKAFGEGVNLATATLLKWNKNIPLLNKITKSQKAQNIAGRAISDTIDIGSDLPETYKNTPKKLWPQMTAAVIIANYVTDYPFDLAHGRTSLGGYSLTPQDVTIDKYRKQEFKDLAKITRIATSNDIKLNDVNFARIVGGTQELNKPLTNFFKQQSKQGMAGGSAIIEATGVQLARQPQDFEWYTTNPNFEQDLRNALSNTNAKITKQGHAVYVNDMKIDVNPIQTGLNNIKSVTVGNTDKYITETPSGIKAINAQVLTRRALVGAFEKGGTTKEPMARYSKDVPRLLALQRLELENQLDLNRQKEILLGNMANVKTGYGMELLKRYQVPEHVQRMAPIKYRGYEQTKNYPKLRTQTDMEVVNYINKHGGYVGGSAAMYLQLNKFRKYGDIDLYMKEGGNINKIADDVLSLAKKTNKKAYMEKATNHIKIKDHTGKDIYDIGLRNENRDSIITINNVKVRKLNQIIKDKREIIKHTKPTEAKHIKAQQDLNLAENAKNQEFKTTYSLKNKLAIINALGYIKVPKMNKKGSAYLSTYTDNKNTYDYTPIYNKGLNYNKPYNTKRTSQPYNRPYTPTYTPTIYNLPYKTPKVPNTYTPTYEPPYNPETYTPTYEPPYNPETYTPTYTPPYNPAIEEPPTNRIDSEQEEYDDSTDGYEPILIYGQNEQPTGAIYKTEKAAIAEGLHLTDKTLYNQFRIRKVKSSLDKLKQPRRVRNMYKFNKLGNMYNERNRYRKDTESNFNWKSFLYN